MATSGVMADFARMPPQRKALVFAAIGMLLGLLYWQFLYKSLGSSLDEAQAEHDSKAAEARKVADDIPKYDDLRTHMTKLRDLIEKNQTALPSEAEVPAFFETLEHKVTETGVEITKWNKKAEEPVESFVKVPVEVEITGTFMQIKRFFASLVQKDVRPAPGVIGDSSEDHERIVSIENLSIGSPVAKNREIILTAKFVAVTFRQEDKPLGAPATPSGAPAPSTKPAGLPPSNPTAAPTPSAPPLPSAATPAGARVRVEKAMEKSDARNRGGGGVDEAKEPAAGSARLKGGL